MKTFNKTLITLALATSVTSVLANPTDPQTAINTANILELQSNAIGNNTSIGHLYSTQGMQDASILGLQTQSVSNTGSIQDHETRISTLENAPVVTPYDDTQVQTDLTGLRTDVTELQVNAMTVNTSIGALQSSRTSDNLARIAGDAQTLQNANYHTDTTVANVVQAQSGVDAAQDALVSANTQAINTQGSSIQVINNKVTDLQTEAQVAATERNVLSGSITVETTNRIAGDAQTLQSANTYTDTQRNLAAGIQASVDAAQDAALATEVTSRTNEDTRIEAAAQANHDAQQVSIDANTQGLATETTNRVAGDAQTLQSANVMAAQALSASEQAQATVDASQNTNIQQNATNIAAIQVDTAQIQANAVAVQRNASAIESNTTEIGNIKTQMDQDRTEARAGVAGAVAMGMAGMAAATTDGDVAMGVGAGHWKGESAVSAAARIKVGNKANIMAAISRTSEGSMFGVAAGMCLKGCN